MPKQRIYSLDVFKLLLAYVVALGHYGIYLPPDPAVAVDYFFILSGFFMGRKFYAKTYQKGTEAYSAWDYTLDHAKTLYPYFLLTLAIAFAYAFARSAIYWVLFPSLNGLWDIGALFYDQIPDLLLLHSSHYLENGLLSPSWQISAMLISGFFVYELLHQNEPLTRKIILPVSLLMLRSLMYTGVGYFENYGLIYMPLLRGFAAIGLGVLTWYFGTTRYWNALKQHCTALNLASVLALAGLILYSDRGRIFLILIPLIILVCQDQGCWINRVLNRKSLRWCGKLSLTIYLCHPIILRITQNMLEPRLNVGTIPLIAIYLILTTICAACILIAVDQWQKRRGSKR